MNRLSVSQQYRKNMCTSDAPLETAWRQFGESHGIVSLGVTCLATQRFGRASTFRL
ncbi:hypothetical protein BCR43DRAFT_498859 [Syncephalastrum racemosum]|uniref:Uncharacterized protein n=1 Tax=Syncephalastrum racemosum TaxID=13706 RepID=A0A1X2H1S2_SYNRA|nr:hypothetical protein BCR43DRAFT_498859 [Syncephalastrum racemosum]